MKCQPVLLMVVESQDRRGFLVTTPEMSEEIERLAIGAGLDLELVSQAEIEAAGVQPGVLRLMVKVVAAGMRTICAMGQMGLLAALADPARPDTLPELQSA